MSSSTNVRKATKECKEIEDRTNDCKKYDELIKEFLTSDKAAKKDDKFKNLRGEKKDKTVSSYNRKIAFLRTHGFPDLPTLDHNLKYKSAPPPAEIKSPKLVFISPVTEDEIKIAPCEKEFDEKIHDKPSFFRLSRRITIPDFCFAMLMYMIQTFGISIERPKQLWKHVQLYRPHYLKDCVVFINFQIKLMK